MTADASADAVVPQGVAGNGGRQLPSLGLQQRNDLRIVGGLDACQIT